MVTMVTADTIDQLGGNIFVLKVSMNVQKGIIQVFFWMNPTVFTLFSFPALNQQCSPQQ